MQTLALLNNKLLNANMTKKFISFYRHPGRPNMNHAGMHFGVGSNIDVFPEQGLIAITLSNYGDGASSVATKIMFRLSNLTP